MGFKLPGKSIQTGTSGHSSALKMVSEQRAASALKKKADKDNILLVPKNDAQNTSDYYTDAIKSYTDGRKDNEAKTANTTSTTKTPPKKSETKSKNAYASDKTWGQGEKDSGGTLNTITKGQRAYEKEMKSKDPKWNKREDNNWKKTQNKINKHLGNSKVYDTIKENKTKPNADGVETVKGAGFNNDKTLSKDDKIKENTNISIEKDKISNAKEDAKNADTKTEKITANKTKNTSQKNISDIKGGRDDKYTGTVVSRTFNKLKSKVRAGQVKRKTKKLSKLEEKNK